MSPISKPTLTSPTPKAPIISPITKPSIGTGTGTQDQ
jgi:hypothetical protein